MSATIHNPTTLGKFGAFVFAREPRQTGDNPRMTLAERFRAWRERRAAVAELSRLSDRCLADIGLTREGIEELVRAAH